MILVKLFLVFILFSAIGVTFTQLLLKTRNKLLLIGSSMLIGPVLFYSMLSLFSYVFKGETAIVTMFYVLVLITFVVILRSRMKLLALFKYFFKFRKSLSNIIISFAILFYLVLFFLTSKSFILSSDSDLYWSIAKSFSRGNYPVMSPFQPNLPIGYHVGMFILEGAVSTVTGVNILSVHCFFSFYILVSLFLLLTGIAREENRSLWCITPAVFGLILFGSPVIQTKGFSNLFTTIFTSGSFHNVLLKLIKYPQLVDLKGSMGIGTEDLPGLLNRNMNTFALGLFLLTTFFVVNNKWRNSFAFKNVFLGFFSVLILSIDEMFFPLVMVLIIYVLFLEFRALRFKRFFSLLLLTINVILISFIVFQNPIKDTFLTKYSTNIRYRVLVPFDRGAVERKDLFTTLPGDHNLMSHYSFSKNDFLSKLPLGFVPPGLIMKRYDFISSYSRDVNETSWYLPNLALLVFIVLVFSLIFKSRFTTALVLLAYVALNLGMFVVDSYYPDFSLRFPAQSYQLVSIGIGYLLMRMVKVKSTIFKIILFFILVGIFAPLLITAHARFFNWAFYPTQYNFKKPPLAYTVLLEKIAKVLPYDKRILFIDGYPFESKSSNITAEALARFGLFVAVSPPDYKMNGPDLGGEYYDITTSLSPVEARKLGLDYIFILNGFDNKFSETRKSQLKNLKFFSEILTDKLGILYKVNDDFKKLPDDTLTLNGLSLLLKDGANVYLDKFQNNEIRRGLILRLANRTQLMGAAVSAGGDYFMYLQSFMPYTNVCEAPDILDKCDEKLTRKLKDIDYVITSPSTQVNNNFTGKFVEIAKIPMVTLWKNTAKI